MQQKQHDLVVIGAGPGGYVAAIKAAQLGLDTACVEKEPRLGGTCLRVGCIPSKALLESSARYHEAHAGRSPCTASASARSPSTSRRCSPARRRSSRTSPTASPASSRRTRSRGTSGTARLDGPGRGRRSDDVAITAKHIIIATGSVSASLPGVELDGDVIGDSTTALSYPTVPKHLIVMGAGYIGLELGSVWRRLGAKVTVVEYLDRILPGMDAEIAREAHKLLKRQGLEFILKAPGHGRAARGRRLPCSRSRARNRCAATAS